MVRPPKENTLTEDIQNDFDKYNRREEYSQMVNSSYHDPVDVVNVFALYFSSSFNSSSTNQKTNSSRLNLITFKGFISNSHISTSGIPQGCVMPLALCNLHQ